MPVNEALRAERVERAARAQRDEAIARESSRKLTATVLVVVGILLLLLGIWFLVRPGVADSAAPWVTNLNKLAIGMTASIAGSILLGAGFIIHTREPIRPPA